MSNQRNRQAKSDKKPLLSELDKSYKRAFMSGDGKIVLEDLKALLGHGKTLYQNKQANTDLHFELGRQSVINDIMYILNKEAK